MGKYAKEDISSDEKKARLAKIREYHKDTLVALGVDPIKFMYGKVSHKPTGKDEKHVIIFDGEIKEGHDIYMEFTSKDFAIEDKSRTLWQWKYNPHYKTEYETKIASNGTRFYYVPIEELRRVPTKQPTQIELDFSEPTVPVVNNTDEVLASQMILRDYACIHLKKPLSDREWLNDLIRKK
jgi:hypothetical protein